MTAKLKGLFVISLFLLVAPTDIRSDYASLGADVNSDGRIGLEDTLYVLKVTSGTRRSESPLIPLAPLEVIADAGNGEIGIYWSLEVDATSYNLYWNNIGNVTTNDNIIRNVLPTYTHKQLTNGRKYYYIVTAVNASGESPPSQEVNAMPMVDDIIFEYVPTSQYSYFYAIWGSDPDNVFVVGPREFVFYYDGNDWSELPTIGSRLPFSSWPLKGIWGSSANNVYAVGEDCTIIHYDGTSWHNSIPYYSFADFTSIWGSSSEDIFAVTQQGYIFHYDGINWRNMSSRTFEYLYDVWGSSGSDVYAVSTQPHSGDGIIFHYNGSEWYEMQRYNRPLRCIWGSSSTDIFVGGNRGRIYHYDGNTLTSMNAPGTNFAVMDIYGSNGNNVFAVYADGAISHYDGANWSPVYLGTGNQYNKSLRGVWVSSQGDVFAVGENGWINNGMIVQSRHSEIDDPKKGYMTPAIYHLLLND